MSNPVMALNKIRGLNQIIGDTISFFKTEYKKIYAFLSIAFGFFIFSSLSSSWLFGDNYSINNLSVLIYNVNEDNFFLYLLSALAYFIGISAHNLAINKSILLIHHQGFNYHNAKTGLPAEIRKNAARIFATSFIYGLLLLFITYVITQTFTFSVYNRAGVLGIAGIIISSLAFLILILFVYPVATFMIMAGLFVSYRDSVSTFQSLKYVWTLQKHKFKKIWIFSFSTSLLTTAVVFSIIGVIFAIMFYNLLSLSLSEIITHFRAAGQGRLMIFNLLGLLIAYTFYPFFQVNCIYQLTSLEEERTGQLLIEKINQL